MQSVSDGEEGIVRTPAGVRWLALLAGLLIAGLGAKSVSQDIRIIHKLTHLDALYPPLPAKFLKVDVRNDSLGKSSDWYPDVLFEYFVDGKSVWGWRFSFEEEPQSKAYWEARLRNYQLGAHVTAYVNPLDPKDSFLEKKRDGLARPILKALLGMGFSLAGILLFGLTVWGWIRNLLGRN